VALNGFRYAFLPYGRKQDLLRRILRDFPMDAGISLPSW